MTDNLLTTDWFRVNFAYLWPDTTTTHEVSVQLYSRSPVFTSSTADKFSTVVGLSDISNNYPEWVASSSYVSPLLAPGDLSETPLYFKKVVDGTNEKLQLGEGSPWAAVNIDADGGFYLKSSPPAVEVQEIISTAVFYLVGNVTDVSGNTVTDPVLFATDWGIGTFTVARDGALYGQTSYATTDPYCLLLDNEGYGSTNITQRSRQDNVATLTLDVSAGAHNISVGDVIVVSGTGASTFNTTTLATAVTTTTVSYNSPGSNVSTTASSGSVQLRSSKFYKGYTLLDLDVPAWEPAHAYHLWLEPQRANLIANPSFEEGTGYWRCSDESETTTIDRYQNDLNPDRPYTGYVYKDASSVTPLVLESNLFPKVSQWASISFNISGSGEFNFGLTIYPADYNNPVYIQSDTITIDGGTADSGFQNFTGLIQVPDDVVEAQFRIEFYGDEFWIDDVLVDPHEGQYTYFDGNSNDSLTDDYRWMGGSDYSNSHFSFWYNNFKNTSSRLIGAVNENGDFVPGLTNEWVPNGSTILAHWDAITSVTPYNWTGDAFYPISDFSVGAVCSTPADRLSFLLVPID